MWELEEGFGGMDGALVHTLILVPVKVKLPEIVSLGCTPLACYVGCLAGLYREQL